MTISRLIALTSSAAFAVLCATLAAVGRIPWVEAGWAAAAVALIVAPGGWWSPVGWRRRAAEAVLVFPAWALVMVADPIQRRMLLPPLLAAAAWAALTAAWPRVPRRRRETLVVLLALSIRAAGGMGLVGWEPWRVIVTVAACGATAWAAARLGGRDLGVAAAFLAAIVPVQTVPVVGTVAVLISLAAAFFGHSRAADSGRGGWLPGLTGGALLGLTVSAWGGFGIERLFPEAGSWTVAVMISALLVSRFLPPGLAGVVWMAAVLVVGPALEPTPDRRGFVLGDELADVDLPAGTGAPYVLDVGLDGWSDLKPGTAVAWLRVGNRTHRLVYPEHAVGRTGDETRAAGRMWRPLDAGRTGSWRAAVRSTFEVPVGVVPHLTRHPNLPEGVTVVLETEGAAHPTPPRNRSLAWWLVAAALAVLILQGLSGSWRWPFALVPWTILIFGSLIARAWVEPLRLVGERLAPDLALAALLTAWLPAAALWLRSRRPTVAVAALLVPLALATPQLTPPLYGDEPFHLAVMESLTGDGDLDLADNIDLGSHPGDKTFQAGGDLLHSPALGVLLLPGYLVAGRTGALVLLALAGALAAALVVRRARRLGVPEARLNLLVLALTATYPLAVFATQIWPELPGVLAVAGILVAATGARGGRWAAVILALLATAVKTRLALLVFPPALAAGWGRRRRRWLVFAVLAGSAAVSLALGWLTMGHPFGLYRRFSDLLPSDPVLAARVVGGLAFDPAGGLLFAAPLWLVALAGLALLWRRGGSGERMLLLGCALTVVALLHSLEWYGGGSPPARYLVPMLPAVALAGGLLLRQPRRWRRLAELLVLPSLALWWVLVTRPHHSINPGDGGWWATDALARSYLVDTAWLVPSFLAPRTATWVVPISVLAAALLLAALARRRPALARRLVGGSVALWLLATAGVVAAIELRTDRVVEAEAPQIRRHGGVPQPREGTASRFTHRRGWMLRDGQAVVVPLNLPDHAQVLVEGWLLASARRGATLELRWDAGETLQLDVRGDDRNGRWRVSESPGAGRHRLTITVRTRPNGAVVLDRLVVRGAE